MSRAMFRYAIPIDDRPHPVRLRGEQVAAAVLESGVLGWSVEFWAEHDDGEGTDTIFRVFGTGHPLPDDARWVATCPRVSGLVFHLFEVKS